MNQENAAIARRYFEELLNGDLSLVDELAAEDIAFHGPTYWGEAIDGRDGFRGFVQALRAAFPNITFTVHDEFGDETRVATRFSFTATHLGEWMGIPPTGRSIDLPGVDTFRIERGRIKEIRVFYDTHGFMQQLGLVPGAAPAVTSAD